MIVFLFMGFRLEIDQTTGALERRTLAAKPENVLKAILFEDGPFENYISDHLPFRDKLLALYFGSGLSFDFGTDKILVGRKKFLFAKSHDTTHNLPILDSYQNKILFSPDKHQKIVDNLIKIKKLCDENHIRLYILFPPGKDRVYFRYMPSYILRENRPSPVKQLVALLPPEITVVPIEDLLIQKSLSSPDLLYYKQDTHWTEDGAFLVYEQLMTYIRQDFPAVKTLAKDDFDVEKRSDVFEPYNNPKTAGFWGKGSLNLPGRHYDKSLTYNHYTYRDITNIKTEGDVRYSISVYPRGYPLKIYMIGDSYASYLHPYLRATFQYVHTYRFNPKGEGNWGIHFDDCLKEMQADGSDILILSISDMKLKDLLEPFQ